MAVGLRQRDPSGNLLVDITTRLPRIMGRVAVAAGVDGSVNVPLSGTNEIFYYFCAVNPPNTYAAAPQFSVSGNVLSWQFLGTRGATGGELNYGRY